jgi:hypothetical protein
MTHSKALNNLLDALKEHRRVANQIYSISPEEVRVILNQLPDAAAGLKDLDPQGTVWVIQALIDEIGFLKLIQIAITQTDAGTAPLPPELDSADPLDGEAGSALASAGFGTDEDYGCFGPDEGE